MSDISTDRDHELYERDLARRLAALMDEIQVLPMSGEDTTSPEWMDSWWSVSDGTHLAIAWFSTRVAAQRYRLAEINRRLNP